MWDIRGDRVASRSNGGAESADSRPAEMLRGRVENMHWRGSLLAAHVGERDVQHIDGDVVALELAGETL